MPLARRSLVCLLLLLVPAVSFSGELKKYKDVISKEAVSTSGLFKVHRVGERVLYEIPPSRLGRDMLWYSEVAKAPAGIGCGGSAIGTRSVRWERVHNRILLRQLSFEKRADDPGPDASPAVSRAVQDSSLPPIIMSFEIEAEGPGGSVVIDATKLLTGDVEEFSAERIFRQAGVSLQGGDGRKADPGRSYVDEVKVFPDNIEVRSVLTFRTAPSASHPALLSASLLVHYSMTLLPDRPMRPRFFDPRVGYFADPYEYYARGESKVVTRRLIHRFRLQKKEPGAAPSEPVKPIVFYVGREVPEKWRPYVRQGIEDWQPAFEAAGFRNAIEARDAPSEKDDPAWDPEDTRYSVVRWGAVPVPNAIGPNIHDPRTGEILAARVVVYQDILKLVQQWYFSMCAALDPRARTLPFPDDLTGEILRYIVAHEVGHTLGLRHNHKASSAYTAEQLRDPAFALAHGSVASIMSYGRFNYVAQPEDGVRQLIPKLGPYDFFAIDWGYRELPEAAGAEAERPLLDALAARQMDEPWLRFGGEDSAGVVDPTVKTQAIGSDPVQTTRLGLKNLERSLDLLLPATSRLGQDFAELKEAYYGLLDTRQAWLLSVANVIGGVVEARTLGGRGGDQFCRLPSGEQRDALRFLLEEGFRSSGSLVRPEIVNKFRHLGVSDPVMQRQKALLQELLSGRRYKLLKDAEVLDPANGYCIAQFLGDVQAGIFSELDEEQPVVDVYRRELHRNYIAHLKTQLTAASGAPPRYGIDASESGPEIPVSATDTDFVAVARGTLGELQKKLTAALPRIRDERTRMHVQDCLREVELLLGNRSGERLGGPA